MALFGEKVETKSCGIDIGKSSIKVVQLKKENGKVKLDTYGEIALSSFAGQTPGRAVHIGEELTLEALAQLFKEAKITTRNAAFSVDPASTFVTTITLPRVSDEELQQVIPFEARKYLPIPISEVEMDHWRMPQGLVESDDEKTFKIVLAAIKHDTLGLYSRYAARIGVENPLFEIESFSLLRSSLPLPVPFSVIVDVGAQFTTVSLIHNGVILDVHLIPRGSQDSSVQLAKALSLSDEEAEVMKREHGYFGKQDQPYAQEVMRLSTYPLFGDIGRLLLVYERKYNQIVSNVFLSGGGVRVPGVMDVCKEVLKGKIVIVSPFERVDTPPFLSDLLTRVGPSYAVALGLALKYFES